MPHLKAFDLIILQYEIGIFQKGHNKVRITVFVWFELTCLRRYFGFNLKKKSCRKSKYLQSAVEFLTE